MRNSAVHRFGIRHKLALGVSLAALGVSHGALAQTCGDGSAGPVCTINNTGTSGPIVGTNGTATIITNSGEIGGTSSTPAISQGGSSVLRVDNQGGISGNGANAIQGTSRLSFGVTNAGTIAGDVVVDDAPAPNMFTGSQQIYYISDGGVLDGNLQLGTTGFSMANFVQREADDGVMGTISAGAGLDIYTKSYETTQSVELGEYVLPATFEIEGYEVLGADTVLTLTGSGTTINLSGNGNVVNDAEIDLVDTTGLYPAAVIPAAIGYYHPGFATYRREQIPLGQAGSFHVIPVGDGLTSFTNNGVVNGDIRIATASFVNNGEINLISNGPGTVVRGVADKDFTFRNDGSIVMTDAGNRPVGSVIEAEFEDGVEAAIRITTAVDSTQLKAVTIENGATGLISGGLSFTGVASNFTFTNAGEIAIGDNPFEIDRAVDINLGNFEIAQNAALREDAVSDSVTITNSGTLDGGIEVDVTTRTLSFTNTGHINADVNDPYAAAVNLFTNDWPDVPGGEDVNDTETLTFLNSASGTIDGSVEMVVDASVVTITNNGSITQALRPGHGATVGAIANSNPSETLYIEQETALGAELVFNNTGTISNADYAGGAVFIDLEAGDIGSGLPGAATANATVTVNNSGSIIASGGNYLSIPPTNGLSAGQFGLDFSVALAVVAEAEGISSVSITNQAGGLIDARGVAHMWNGSSVEALPEVEPGSAGGLAIAVSDAYAVTIVNDGTIRGGPGGPLQIPEGPLMVPINAGGLDFEGVVGGTIDTFGGSADTITNSSTGVIEGSVALRSGNDIFRNHGTLNGDLYLGSGDDTFILGANATFTGTADGGSGLDTFVRSYDASQSVTIGQGLPTAFEFEGYEILGSATTLTLTGSGETIILSGDGNVVNNAEIGLVDLTGFFPIEVIPAAISYSQPQQSTYQRQNVPPGQLPFYTIPFGGALTSFTNDGNGIVNGDIQLATASFTNNGTINLASKGPGTVIRSAADKDFLFRNTGSIMMTDNGSRPVYVLAAGEFEHGTDHAVRIVSAVDSTVPKSVTIENAQSGVISGGLAFNGIASDFTFNNAGTIVIGDNPLGIDRAVDIEMVEFPIALDPSLRADVVANSVTLINSGTLDGGIDGAFTTRTLSFTNSGHINADVNDPYAAAVGLSTNDWPDVPDGEDVNDTETLTFLNTTSGTIVGSVEMEANASLVTITNNGSITQALRPGHGVVVGAIANSYPTETLAIEQETALGAELVFNNTGTISNADLAGGAVLIDLEAGDIGSGLPGAATANATVTVNNSGSIIASGGSYLTFPPAMGLSADQIGIDYSVALAVVAEAEGISSVSITNQAGGLIDARGTAHMWTGNVQVVPGQGPDNGGLAIAVADANTVTIVNDGTIRGGPGGPLQVPDGALLVPLNADGLDFEGVWGGAIDTFGGSADTITNSSTGVIEGSVALRSGDDTFINNGTFTGNLYLGDGDDTFIQAWDATFTGTADGGAGRDTFILDLEGHTGDTVDLSIHSQLVSFEVLQTRGAGGVDIIGSDDGGEYEFDDVGSVDLGTGDDIVTVTGSAGPVNLGEGNNTFDVAPNATITGNVQAGVGDDNIQNQGTIVGQVDLGGGSNTFVNAPNATITGDVQAGAGDDNIQNQGEIVGQVDLGGGSNTFVNTSTATITGNVQAGSESDHLTNQGTIDGDIVLDGGSAPLPVVAFGLMAAPTPAALAPTGGDDVLVNDGTVTGNILAGAGDDKLTNSGIVGGNIDLGEGNDELVLKGAWEIGGTVNGGEGTDTVKVTFADAPSETDLPVLDLSGFESIEQFDVEGGVGKIGGEVAFEEINVNSGRLIGAADSVITADVNVASGGTFGSAGKVVGDINVASGGTLSPGASPAVMTVVGDVSLASGSITTFEFVPAPGQSDQMIIDGDLTIASGATLNLVGERPLTPGVTYDMIIADNIDGQFTIGNWDQSAIQGFLRYLDDRLQLMGTFVAPNGASPQAVASIDYVNSLLIAGDASTALLGSIPTLLGADGYASAASFARISPEPYASASQLGIEQGLSIARTFRSGIAVPTQPEARFFTFASGFGDWRTLKSSASTGVSRAKSESYGILGGVGYGSETGSVAAFIGHMDSEQRIKGLDARTDADGMVAGVTGHVASGGFDLTALIAYDWSDAKTKRTVPGNAGVASRSYDLESFILDVSAGYSVPVSDDWAVQPQLGLTHVATRRGRTSETGSAAFALDVEKDKTNATFIDGGIALHGGQSAEATFQPWVRLGLRHQLGGRHPTATAGFVGNAARFTVHGATRKETVVTAGAGFSAELSSAFRVFAAYQGEFGGGTGSQANIGFELAF